jgi:ubiquinone/menaquinone biosynthesis C-methylase UbiE
MARASAEAVPFEPASFDTVVTTWTSCTIPDVLASWHEMHRVLRPDRRMLFVEHGRAPDRAVVWWQDHLTPLLAMPC